MRGMLKKDLLMIKNNSRFFVVVILMYVIYTFAFDMDMSFFLPFMGFIVAMSTFSYDDFNNWHAYAGSFPQGKVNVVKSKYIISIVLTLILALIGLGAGLAINSSKGTLNIEEQISGLLGVLLAIEFMMSVMYPIIFKYGAEKGRIAMIVMAIIIMGIMLLFTKVLNIEISESLMSFLDTYFLAIFAIVSVIMVFVSFLISKKIYMKREF